MKITKLVNFTILAALIVMSVCASALADDVNAPGTASVTTLSLELKDTSVKDAIVALFKGTDYKYYIQPGVSGQIKSLTLKNVTIDRALKAIANAAGLTYTVEDGTYIIGPAKVEDKSQQSVVMSAPGQSGTGPTEPAPQAKLTPSQQPQAQVENQSDLRQVPASTQVVINQPPAPIFYGHPAPPPPDYDYGYRPVYQFGNTRIIGGGYAPVVVAGGATYILGYGPLPPPPPGFLGPDVSRFLRSQYYIQSRPFFITPY